MERTRPAKEGLISPLRDRRNRYRRHSARNARKVERKQIAREHLDKLFALAISESQNDPELARSHAQAAFKIATRFNLKLKKRRRLICRSCRSLLLPASGARYRLSKRRKGMNVTCLKCGAVYRLPFVPKIQLAKSGSPARCGARSSYI